MALILLGYSWWLYPQYRFAFPKIRERLNHKGKSGLRSGCWLLIGEQIALEQGIDLKGRRAPKERD
jgi:hypothetical protein